MEGVRGQRAGENMVEGEVPPPNAGARAPWHSRPLRIYASSLEEVQRWRDPAFLEEERRRQIAMQGRAADPMEIGGQAAGDGGVVEENNDAEGNGPVGGLAGNEVLAANQTTVDGGRVDPADVGTEQDGGIQRKNSGNEETEKGEAEEVAAKQKTATEDGNQTSGLYGWNKTLRSQVFKKHTKKFGGRLLVGASRKNALTSGTVSVPRKQLRRCINLRKEVQELQKLLMEKDKHLEKLLAEKNSQRKNDLSLGCPPVGSSVQEERVEALVKVSVGDHGAGALEKDRRKPMIGQGGELCDLVETGSGRRHEEVVYGGPSEGSASLDRNHNGNTGESNEKNVGVPFAPQSSCNETTSLSISSDLTRTTDSGNSKTPFNQVIRPLSRSHKTEAVTSANCSLGHSRKTARTKALLFYLSPASKPVPESGKHEAQGQAPNLNAGAEDAEMIRKTGSEGVAVGRMPGTKPFACSLCDLSYSRKHDLKRHTVAIHEGKTPFACETCGKGFSQKTHLESHRKSHYAVSQRDLTCEFCNKICRNRRALKAHQRKHTRSQNAGAEDSGETSKTGSEGVVTGKMSGGKRFPCPHCSLSYIWKKGLKRHLEIVHEGKNFECGFCGKAFGDKACMERHQRRQHSFLGNKNPESFTCPVCSKLCDTTQRLEGHMRRRSCPQCPGKFECNSKMKEHVDQVHKSWMRFSCEVCGKKFVRRERKDEHLLGHHTRAETELHLKSGAVKGVSCLFCGKVFGSRRKLEQHVRGHTEEKPWICVVCNEEFSSDGGLWYHKVRDHNASGEKAEEGVALSRNAPAKSSEHGSEAGTEWAGAAEKPAGNNSLTDEADLDVGSVDSLLLDQSQLELPCDDVNDDVLTISADEWKQVTQEESGSVHNPENNALVALAQTSSGSVGSMSPQAPGPSFPHQAAIQHIESLTNPRKRNAPLVKSQRMLVTKKRMKNDVSAVLTRTTRVKAKVILPTSSNRKPA